MPAALQRGRMLRAQGLEELDQLLARLVLLPVAVALHDLDQVIHRRSRPDRAGTAPSPAGSGLVIVGIGLDAGLQVGRVAQHASLLGQGQRRLGAGDRDVAGDLLGRAVEQLPASANLRSRDQAAGEAADRLGLGRILGQHLLETGDAAVRVSPCSAASCAAASSAVAAGSAAVADQPVDQRLDLALGLGARRSRSTGWPPTNA